MNNKILLTPGPVEVPIDILKTLAEPMIHHRTPAFVGSLKSVLEKLKYVFGTKNPVFIHTATGSGAMESAVVNTLSFNDEVICIVSGKFGERWSEICKTYNLKVHQLNVEWGHPVKISDIEKMLIAHPNVKAVFCQYCETSTATIHPIKEIAQLVKTRSHTIFLIDAITAVAALPLEMDNWGLDVVVAGSQKAFMMPTGLSFIAMSEKAWQLQKSSNLPKYYFDLAAEKKTNEKAQTFFSSSVSLIKALDVALNYFTGDLLRANIHRCTVVAETLRECTQILGLSVYSKAPSNSVTAICVPSNIDGEKLCASIEDNGVTVMGGQDQLKGKIIRIGHLGQVPLSHFEKFLLALCKSLNALGHKIEEDKLKLSLEHFAKKTASLNKK